MFYFDRLSQSINKIRYIFILLGDKEKPILTFENFKNKICCKLNLFLTGAMFFPLKNLNISKTSKEFPKSMIMND